MGSTCQFVQNEQKKSNQAYIKVQAKKIPNKQQYLEKYTYNLQENMDSFDEDFFQKSFHLELLNQNAQIDVSSENLCLKDSSQNDSIEIQQYSHNESVNDNESLVISENNCIYKQNQKSRLQERNKKSNFYNSPLKSILKVPSSYQRINIHSNDIFNLKKRRVRFRSSDKVSNSSGRRRKDEKKIKSSSLKNKFF